MTPKITYNKDGSLLSLDGFDAIEVYRVATLRSAIGLLEVGITPTRGFTMKKALLVAKTYTGKDYKRTDAKQAKEDLKVWLELMKSTIPVEVRS